MSSYLGLKVKFPISKIDGYPIDKASTVALLVEGDVIGYLEKLSYSNEKYLVTFDRGMRIFSEAHVKQIFELYPNKAKFVNGYENYYNKKVMWIGVDYLELINVPLPVTNKIIRQPGEPYLDGSCCSKCGTFAVYAAKGFTCFSCKQDPYRLSPLVVDDWDSD